MIVPLSASGWAVFYGADETLHVDLVPSSIDAARTNVLAETGDLFGVATSGPAEPMLLVAKHPTRPARARVQLVNVTAGTLADLTTYNMPVSIDAIDVHYVDGVYWIGLTSVDGTTRVLTTRACE
ncbi:MAG: hypothetical protein AAF938_16420 [Myxococcota bacterium]